MQRSSGSQSKTHGDAYEEYVNKFFKGTISRKEAYDIETRTALYEVKGSQMIHWQTQNKKQIQQYPRSQESSTRFGHYTIDAEHHEELKTEAEAKHKKPRYVFVLAVGKRLLFKTMNWIEVDMLIREQKTRRSIKLHIKNIWGVRFA